ncbi:protein trunk [Anoplophora glabripennis]|uniref:protein trunk n=1 Tax=Anoplophora glabripennis TaxID=217634 RepID=UPI00087498D2|nr:protein trunk [Anoplophora glabripennis]
MCVPRLDKQGKVPCTELSEVILEETLGAAFNARYMSIDMPSLEVSKNFKRKVGYDLDFYVDSEYEDDSDEQPAWSVTNHVEETKNIFSNNRYRRDMDYLQEWHCKSRIKWTDLGPDYFPRYLRSVECLTESCWFNMYKCRPRSFTVKILKRKRDRCVPSAQGPRTGASGLPRELRELWVWEEKAVNFCCDCSP